ncbi:hypothetical protein [Paenibacillus dendritiformis]|uniref:hypothetical protein n=1 Tax=Paenibacillus dendritiformis TaxID=130049 RepID=UPI001A7E5DA8|nr:hypothetical protein [Paenibacillus dendritiformis]
MFPGRVPYAPFLQKCSILPVESRNEAQTREIDALLQEFLLRRVFCGENPASVQDFYRAKPAG